MNKKLTKHGNSFALVIDKPLLKLLKADKNTNFTITFNGESLIITPTKHKKSNKKAENEIDEIAKRIMDKYEHAFKKLAKT